MGGRRGGEGLSKYSHGEQLCVLEARAQPEYPNRRIPPFRGGPLAVSLPKREEIGAEVPVATKDAPKGLQKELKGSDSQTNLKSYFSTVHTLGLL
jgi:hypothetical protein